MLYHGVRRTAAGCLYRLGVALLDLDTAEHCLLRGDSWIFGPEAPYERQGDVGYVTFPCGYTLGADGDAINLYYGAADTSVAMATGSVSQLLCWLDQHGTAYPMRMLPHDVRRPSVACVWCAHSPMMPLRSRWHARRNGSPQQCDRDEAA